MNMRKKTTYRCRGYYNVAADLRILAGQPADRIVAYWKEGQGAFSEGNTDNELDGGEADGAVNVSFTGDRRYLVVDGTVESGWPQLSKNLKEDSACDFFIDIYELVESEDADGSRAAPARYELFTWPDSQEYVGRDGCILIMPPEDDEGCSLDSAYMVPESVLGHPVSDDRAFVLVGFPDSQKYENEEGVFRFYDGEGLFVPYGIAPDRITCLRSSWEYTGKSGEAPDKPSWELVEDIPIADRFNHAADSVEAYRMYSCGSLHVFTHTSKVEERDDEGGVFGAEYPVCKVFFGFHSFVEGVCEDFHFPENETTLKDFLESLNAAWKEKEGGEPSKRWPAFVTAFRETMAHASYGCYKPGWTEIYKENPDIAYDRECGAPEVTGDELAVIREADPDYTFAEDGGNALYAFKLFALTRDQCDDIVDRLNRMLEEAGKEPCWYLGDEDEEYVDCF